jgi:hypothetical protein
MARSAVTNDELKRIRNEIIAKHGKVFAWMIKEEIKKLYQYDMDVSTIRGRFIEMGEPLSGQQTKPTDQQEPCIQPESSTQRKSLSETVQVSQQSVVPELQPYVPAAHEFDSYVERSVDTKLAAHLNTGKHPICQGKQGTGKTTAYMYYAWKNNLPYFCFSGHEDFKLRKHFGDKTIENSSIKFQEGLFVKAIQGPSVVLFDEINAIPNAKTFDFHELLQNGTLYIKDAESGKGKVYRVHPECRIGFAQNPKSAKYIGGVIKPSNFLGRCTYISFPDFKKKEVRDIIRKRYPNMDYMDVSKFTDYYFAVCEAIERSKIPVDISIRQLLNVIDLWMAGLDLREALEDGLISILDAVSQPQVKDSFMKLAEAVWKELKE